MVIVPEEAAIVKRIYQNFLDGKSRLETEKEFAAEGITTRAGTRWVDSNLKVVLSNVTYTGNMLYQKEYIADPITKKVKKNHGELPQYYVENTHPAIIDKETIDYVQREMAPEKRTRMLRQQSPDTQLLLYENQVRVLRQKFCPVKEKEQGQAQQPRRIRNFLALHKPQEEKASRTGSLHQRYYSRVSSQRRNHKGAQPSRI